MMKQKLILFLVLSANLLAANAQRIAPDLEKVKGGDLAIQPISHATLALTYQDKNIYVDPIGGAEAFKGLGAPDIILVTDIHGDHFDFETIEAVKTDRTTLIVPKAVADLLPASFDQRKLIILNNGDSTSLAGFTIAAVPMYNLPEAENADYHIKGRGNGYVLQIGNKKVYISGDTANIPEMRALKNIDIAFVCMNLPYTMDVKAAAQGVLAFNPKTVYPYHYRGQDVNEFKRLVNTGNKHIEVRLRDWYASPK